MQSVYSTASPDWPTRWRGLTSLPRCSRCILQLHPTGPLVGEVSPLYRDAVGVFYSFSRLAHSLARSHLSTEMQSVYSTASPYWPTRWRGLTSLPRCSRCILQLHPTGPLVGEVSPLYRDAVGVFYSFTRLDHSLARSHHSTEMQSVYSTASPDWPTRWRGLTSLPRCSRCILQLYPTRPLVGEVSPLYRDAVGVFYSFTRLDHSLARSHLSTEMQSVYSTASPD